MKPQHFMRVLPDDAPTWERLGWRPVVGVYVLSLDGHEILLEWDGDGDPALPPRV